MQNVMAVWLLEFISELVHTSVYESSSDLKILFGIVFLVLFVFSFDLPEVKGWMFFSN